MNTLISQFCCTSTSILYATDANLQRIFVVVCIELNVSTVVVSLVSVHCRCGFKPFKSTVCAPSVLVCCHPLFTKLVLSSGMLSVPMRTSRWTCLSSVCNYTHSWPGLKTTCLEEENRTVFPHPLPSPGRTSLGQNSSLLASQEQDGCPSPLPGPLNTHRSIKKAPQRTHEATSVRLIPSFKFPL